jgi:hypothetical protein
MLTPGKFFLLLLASRAVFLSGGATAHHSIPLITTKKQAGENEPIDPTFICIFKFRLKFLLYFKKTVTPHCT